MSGMLNGLELPGRLSHKGENGRVFILAGSRQYHGAPAFCTLGARRFADLIYFMGADTSPGVLQAVRSIPEAIIVDSFPEADCALYGPGLGKARPKLRQLLDKYEKAVVDGDGLRHIGKKDFEGLLITPHEGEFRALFGIPGTAENVEKAARVHRCAILKKGPVDFISDGQTTIRIKGGNAGMTKGGTGDVLSGLTAALLAKNEPVCAACAASRITKAAGEMLFKTHSYAYCASDLAEMLPYAYKKLLR